MWGLLCARSFFRSLYRWSVVASTPTPTLPCKWCFLVATSAAVCHCVQALHSHAWVAHHGAQMHCWCPWASLAGACMPSARYSCQQHLCACRIRYLGCSPPRPASPTLPHTEAHQNCAALWLGWPSAHSCRYSMLCARALLCTLQVNRTTREPLRQAEAVIALDAAWVVLVSSGAIFISCWVNSLTGKARAFSFCLDLFSLLAWPWATGAITSRTPYYGDLEWRDNWELVECGDLFFLRVLK